MRKTFILMFLMMFCSFGFGQNHWNQGVDGNSFPDHLNVIATVHIDEELQGGQNSNLELAAFCGDELRGVATLVYEEGLGKSLAYLMLYGKEGDQITFRVYDGTSKKEYIDLNVLDYKEDYDYGYGLKGKLGQIDSPYEVSFSAVASVPAQGYEVIYETLPTAVEAANAEQTVTLLKSVQGAGLKINKDITVDFGGKTYTINQAVGSTGTESQGFQLLKNNTVTLKNGNIAIAENTNVKWMFNAYAKVTLQDLNVNCTNMAVPAANEKNYVLVVNNGGGATPTVNYDDVEIEGFTATNAPLYVDPSTKLVAEAGLNVETDKGYVVEYADNAYTAVAAVAKIGDVYYRTLPLAVEAATAGQTVELIADATGAGLVINKDITVDFGGKTYTINQAVGSTGTESQGFQLLKDNTVTLQNGYIAIAKNTNVKWMFNAYANVTLAGLNVNCTNMATPAANEANYVLVVNNGGGATPTVNYSGVNVTNFPSTNQIWLDPTTTFKAVASLEDLIETEEGYVVVYNNGEYTAVKANVQVKDGETVKGTYATIAEAVTEAQAGNTIVLLNDMNENATITKNLTIDGAGKNYTGTMSGNNSLTITIKNVNFVNAGFVKGSGNAGTYTFTNCTFDGAGNTYYYPLKFKGANKITVEECTVKDYKYSFLYVTSSTTTVNVNNVTVENCPNYAVYFSSGVAKATFKNLTVKNSDRGFLINNTANRAFTIENCKLENVTTAIDHANGTYTITCTMLGNKNDFGASALSEYAKIVLAETEATLSAPESLNVTTSVEGKAVVYENGVYKVAPAVASITANEVTRYYATLQAAVNAAQANETVTLLSDAAGAGVVIDKNVIIDFNDKTYTVNQAVGSSGTETLGFQILKNNNVTLKNGTLTSTTPVVSGKEVKMLVQNYANLTLTDMNLVDDTDHILYALSNNSGNVNLDGNTNITTDKVAFDVCKYASYTEPIVNVNTTGVIAGDIEVTTTQQTNLNISGGKFTKELQLAWCAEGYVPVKDGEYWTVVEGAIEVTYEDGSVAYFSRMIDAVPYNNNTALKNATIKLLNNCEGEGMRFWQNGMTFDLNGFKYTITEGTGSPTTKSQGFQIRPEVTGTVTIKGGTIDIKQGANVKWMFNNYAADFVVENVILECENMVTGTNEDYLLVVQNAGDKATFNNVTVNGYDAKKVYLTPGSTFTAPEEFAVETDNGYVVIYDNGTYTAQQAVAEVDGVQYATLQAAYDAAEAGETVTLLINATGAGVVIDKNIIVDFGGKTYTINQAVGSSGTETLGFQILKNKTVTLMNGTLISTAAVEGSKEIKMLIQNYAHLTLSGMNLVDNTDHILYALSNNSGNVNLVGNTNITTDEVAFDVYDYTAGGYTAPEVNVNTTGIIDGKIEVSESISNNLNISGGLFTAQIAEAWCADGYIPTTEVVDGTTYNTVKVGEYVAKIGDKKYEKFADAIAAVNNGETITLLTDNAESVIIKQVAGKSFTIDGADKTYKGTITVNGNKRSTGAETLTIKNVNFLAEGQWQSSIDAVKSTFVHNVTIDGCTFTGNDAKEAYGIRLRHSYNIVVKNTTGYKLFDLVYANTAVTGFTAENVTVTESGMGFMMPYGKNLSFKNVTLNVEGAGVGIYNYNASTATFENCDFTADPPVHLEQKNATNAYSLTFNGTNTFAGSDKWLKVIGTDAKFTVTLNDPSLDVHKTSGLIAGVGNVYYNTFDYALAQAKSTQEEDAVNILETVILSADKAINFENIAVTSTVNPAFRITDGANVTVEKGNMNTEDGGYNFILGASDGSSAGNLTIKSGKYHASTTVASVTKGNLVIEDGEFSATPYNGDCRFLINCIDANYNADPRTANVEIKGGTFVGFDPENNAAEGAGTNFCADGYLSDDNGDGTYTVRQGVYVAQVNDGAKYESLVEAVAAAEDNDVVKLLDDATGAGLVINKDITVDFGGFTYTINQAVGSTGTETQGFQLLPSAENVALKNGTINVDGANVIWMINDYAKNLTVEAMTFNCSGMNLEHSAVMGLVINNLNNTDPKVVFGENVIFNGLTTSILLEHDTQLTAGEGWMNAIEPEDGYVVVYKEGVYTVARPVASITREGVTTEYATLGDATAAAVNGDVVNLLCDVNGSEVTVDLQVAKKITVDLGGHKYTSTGTAFIAYRAGTELTLTNGTVHGNGAAGATLRTTYKATLTLGDNLTVTAGPQALAILVQDGKFFVNPNTDNVIVNGGIDCIKVQENALEVSIASGTYTEDVQEWCADGYVSQDNGNGTWTVREADYVAEIEEGGAKYESLKAAIDAAQDGQTVIVLKDITLGYEDANDYFDPEKQYKSFFNISGKAVTVNLNEKTVKAVLEGEETVMAFFSTENGGDLTIKGGNLEIDTEKAVYSLLVCYTGGKLTVENGNYKLNLAADDLVYTQEDNNVVINGGTFYLGNVGTGQNGQPWIINAKGQNSANVDVNGGTFNADINHQFWANEVYVPETLALKDNGDGTWTIEKSVAYVVERAISTGAYDRNVGYATLAEAVNPLGNSVDNTVTVIKSHELAETVIVNKNVEFIFENGVQVTAPEYSYENGVHTNPTAFRIVDGATVTVNSFNITSGVNGLYNFILGAADGETTGNLVINDGTFVANTSVVSVTKGNLVIEGGDFSLVEGTTDYRYLINCIDANYNNGSATVAISGGTFHNWNPQDNAAETGGHANFCASGYGAVETATDSNIWMVVPMQGITLLSGWNWFSSYINIEGEEGLETLQNALAGNATIIKSQSSEFTAYSQNGQWYGGLTSLSIDKMYMIEMSNAHTLSLTGDIVDPSTVNITLKQGWNWIAYPISEEYAIEDVMVNDIIAKNDQVKSHKEGFAEYFNGSWYGDLNTLKPGQGYMYGNKDGEHQFTYTIPAPGAKSELRANVTAENNHWVPASSQFVNNMTMVAMVDGVNADSYEVAAFANGEVRGSARPIYIEPLDAYMLFLTIYGDEVEEMTFRYYDLTTGEEYALDDRINYSNDARVGSIAEPYIFRGTVGIGENAMTEINIYPNPTTTGSEVNLGSVCDTVEVFNALGVKIAEYQNVDAIDALETAGIYVIRITNNGNVQNCRLIVK